MLGHRNLHRIWLAPLAGLILFTTPALAQTGSLAEIAAYQGPDRQQRLVEGAKKEGEVMFYASIPVEDIAVLTAAFDKKYGIKVKVWRADSEGFLQRIVSEAKAKRYEVDVIAGSSSALEPLHTEKLLTEVKSPYLADFIPGSIAPHREWASPQPARPEPARPRRLLRWLPDAGMPGRESLLAADRDGLPEWGPDQHPLSSPILSTLHPPFPTNRPVSRPYRAARLDS